MMGERWRLARALMCAEALIVPPAPRRPCESQMRWRRGGSYRAGAVGPPRGRQRAC
jgi:hypothetical protein